MDNSSDEDEVGMSASDAKAQLRERGVESAVRARFRVVLISLFDVCFLLANAVLLLLLFNWPAAESGTDAALLQLHFLHTAGLLGLCIVVLPAVYSTLVFGTVALALTVIDTYVLLRRLGRVHDALAGDAAALDVRTPLALLLDALFLATSLAYGAAALGSLQFFTWSGAPRTAAAAPPPPPPPPPLRSDAAFMRGF